MCTLMLKPPFPSPNQHVQLYPRNLLSGPLTFTPTPQQSQTKIITLKPPPPSIFIISMNDTISSQTDPHQNPGPPSRVSAVTIHIQSNLKACRNLSCVPSMPISFTTLSYGQALFASCLDYHISLLFSLPLAFIFVVKCYFFLKNLTCITFFRGSLMTRL